MITGGAAGIGAATARDLVARGHRVLVLDIDRQGLDRAVSAMGAAAHGEVVDVTRPREVEAAMARGVARFGPIEILINNVGGNTEPTPVDQISEVQWDRVFDVNMKTMFTCTRLVVPRMKEAGWGRIVNVSSIAGRTRTHFTNAAYTAAKAAVIGFSRQCAAELAPFGVTVNVVAPGVIATERIEAVWSKKPEADRDRIQSLICAGRLGKPEEVASAILSLCDEQAGYTTGSVLDVCGGMFIG